MGALGDDDEPSGLLSFSFRSLGVGWNLLGSQSVGKSITGSLGSRMTPIYIGSG